MDTIESLDLQNTSSDEHDVIMVEFWFFVPDRLVWDNFIEVSEEEED